MNRDQSPIQHASRVACLDALMRPVNGLALLPVGQSMFGVLPVTSIVTNGPIGVRISERTCVLAVCGITTQASYVNSEMRDSACGGGLVCPDSHLVQACTNKGQHPFLSFSLKKQQGLILLVLIGQSSDGIINEMAFTGCRSWDLFMGLLFPLSVDQHVQLLMLQFFCQYQR